MLFSAVGTPGGIRALEGRVERDAVWIDICAPTPAERVEVEHATGVELPSRVRMRAIEPSDRLVAHPGLLEMAFTSVANSTGKPSVPIACILTQGRLITVHERELRPIDATRAFVECHADLTPQDIFLMIVEETVDEIGDGLEMLGSDIDMIAARIFAGDPQKHASTKRVHRLIQELGRHGTQIMRLQECLASLERLGIFMEQHREAVMPHARPHGTGGLHADVHALAEFAEAVDSKIDFLLNAMLGMIAVDQNQIMMVLSLTAAMFLPATLISSIFGMNFASMPGLSWHHGFLLSIGAMLVAAGVVWTVFRLRRWM